MLYFKAFPKRPAMSAQTDTLRELARLLNAREPVDVARFFTEDFRLDDPGAGVTRVGHAGAQQMIDAVLAFAPGMRLEILDMFEQGDRVAVRWQVATGATGGGPAMLAIYQFAGGRIVRDWGISVARPWPSV
jgi:hypothetical protein